MDKRVQELVDYTRNKWKLENYHLHTYNFYRKINMLNKTIYTLSMEWFPTHITDQVKEDSNPDGTAVIEIDVNCRQFERVIFVGGKSCTNGNVICNQKDIIKWIEKETGLKYGEQFELQHEEEREFCFRGCVNGVAISPSGTIEVNFNKEGKITLFSLFGQFPSKDSVNEETFSLTLDNVEHHAKDQLKLIEFPSRKGKKFIPVYCIDEMYIANDQSHTIRIDDVRLKVLVDKVVHWDSTTKKSFKRQQINVNDEVTVEQALSFDPHPDLLPITSTEKEKCLHTVKDFLSSEYPNDSGKWNVNRLYRENGFILATLKEKDLKIRVVQRKLKLFIDATTLKVFNYMDNKDFIEVFDGYNKAAPININNDTAYETIKSKIELKPVYVYDLEQDKYLLCGELNSDFGMNASNGQLINLNDLLL